MAGKTFSGIGVDDLDKLIPPVGPDGAAAEAAPAPGDEAEDVRGVYSGPTVVDDDKVAEGLKRLRSLERTTAVGTGPPVLQPSPLQPPPRQPPPFHAPPLHPPPAAGEVAELVADMDSSEPTKIGMPHQRPTAVGRSISDEIPGQQQPVGQPDNLRGTMFGHTVHLPDLHIPIDTDEPSGSHSGPIYVPPPAAATQQLVRYQPPSQRVSAISNYPMQAEPFHRGSPFPSNEPDLRTETIPPLGKRTFARALATVVGLVVLGAASTLAFRYYRANEAAASSQPEPPAAPAQAQAAGAQAQAAGAQAQPPGAQAEPAAGTTAEVAPPPPHAAKPSPANDPPLPENPPPRREHAAPSAALVPPPAPAPADGDGRSRRRPARADRRRAPAAAAPAAAADVPEAAPKPPPRKKPALDEDPDATLPPSTTE